MKPTVEQQRLRIGEVVPNFQTESTEGKIDFYPWSSGNWILLFSMPPPFHPVGLTEQLEIAKAAEELAKRHVKVIGIGHGSITDYEHSQDEIKSVYHLSRIFPIIGDEEGHLIREFGMGQTDLEHSLLLIDSSHRVQLILSYPIQTGYHFFEVFRVLDSLNLHAKGGLLTPANWHRGYLCLLPSEDKEKFKRQYRASAELSPHLRYTIPTPELWEAY